MPDLSEAMMLLATANKEQENDFSLLNDRLHMDDLGLPIRFGMTSEFIFNSYGQLKNREVTVRLAEEYYDATDRRPNVFVQGENVFSLKSVGGIRRRLQELTDPDRTLSFYIKYQAPGEGTLIPNYRKFSCLIDGQNHPRSGSLTYTHRYSDMASRTTEFIQTFIKTCQSLNVFYGVSGFSLIVFTYDNARMHTMYPLYQRFPGLLYADPGGFTSDSKRRDEVIRDVNWLTAINDANLARLGGIDEIRKQLSADIVLHPYEGGVVFQAGPGPRIGDRNHGDVPEAYRQVNHLLKPLRFQDYTAPYYLRVPDDVNRKEATEAWISRFD